MGTIEMKREYRREKERVERGGEVSWGIDTIGKEER